MEPTRRWQLGVVHFVALAVAGGIVTAAITAPPSEVSGLLLAFLSFALPVACLLGIFYIRGAWRAFAIGAAIPAFELWCLSVLAALFAGTNGFGMMNEPVYTPTPVVPAATTVTTVGSKPVDDGATGPDELAAEPPAETGDVLPGDGSAGNTYGAYGVAPAPPPGVSFSTSPPAVNLHFVGPSATLTGFARMFRVGAAVYGAFAVASGAFSVGIYWLIHRAARRPGADVDGMPQGSRWQFGLRHLMFMSAIAAVICAAITARPTWYGGLLLGLISLAMPAACAMGIVYGRGAWRAFSIGAAIPVFESWFLSSMTVVFATGMLVLFEFQVGFGLSLPGEDVAALSLQMADGSAYTVPLDGLGTYFTTIPVISSLFAAFYSQLCGVYASYAVGLGLFGVAAHGVIETMKGRSFVGNASGPAIATLKPAPAGSVRQLPNVARRSIMKLVSPLKSPSAPLLACAATTAVVIAAVACPVNWFTGLVLGFLSFAFPTACVLAIVYAGGYVRTFAIGALVPSLEGWFVSAMAVLAVGAEIMLPTTAAVPAVAMAPSPPAQGVTVKVNMSSPDGTETLDQVSVSSYLLIPDVCRQFGETFQVAGAVYWSFSIVLGLFAVTARWLVERAKAPRGLPAAEAQPGATAASAAPSNDFTALHAAHPTPPSPLAQTAETRIGQHGPPK